MIKSRSPVSDNGLFRRVKLKREAAYEFVFRSIPLELHQ